MARTRLGRRGMIAATVTALAVASLTTGSVGVASATTPRANTDTGKQLAADKVAVIDSIVNAAKNAAGTPGIMVGIWDPKLGTLVKGYGTTDTSDPKAAFTATDHTRIASVSKTFTATAILQLVADGKLKLDDTLSQFVPDIPNGDQITVQQMLDMTAGIFSYTEDDGFLTAYFANPQLAFGDADALAIIRAHQPDFVPGTDIHYSDSNYLLLGMIAEKVTGQPFDQVIQTQILDKVGLDETSYPTTDQMPEPFSHGYLLQPVGPPRDVTSGNPGVAGGAGAMISTVDDLHKWATVLGTGTLLPKDLQKQRLVTKPLVDTPQVKIRYGMGITNLNGFIGHDGGILGYSTAMFYSPKHKSVIVVSSNTDNVSAQSALWTFIGIASYLYPDQFPNGL
ncbi:MAG: serine hydrolase domain-containing protein [Acidimicrobiia bacterium]